MIGASILSRIIEPPELQGFVLVVHRERLLEDVLRQIFLFGPFDFKKPLRVGIIHTYLCNKTKSGAANNYKNPYRFILLEKKAKMLVEYEKNFSFY